MSTAIAAKNAIVSRVRTTSSALPPPGRATSASATSAITPNFQANCTPRTLRGPWRSATGGSAQLLDHRRGRQNQDERSERDAVDHEDGRRVVGEVSQQEGNREIARDEREQRGHHQAEQRGGLPLLPAQDRAQLEQPAQHDGGDREEEREGGGPRAAQAHEDARRDGPPRARHTG